MPSWGGAQSQATRLEPTWYLTERLRVGKRMVILLMLVRVVFFVLGAYLVFRTCLSALRTFVLPRSAPDRFNRTTFIVVRQLFEWRSKRLQTYLERDRAMELYAPVALIALLVVWLFSINLGYIAMDWAIAAQSWYVAFKISGSSLLTLGFALVDNLPTAVLVFSEATIGLILIALLIAYLPTIYAAFSRREAAVTMLEVRAGSPPSAVEMIKRYTRLKRLEQLGELWTAWEAWFVDLEESHTPLAAAPSFLGHCCRG